MDHIGFIWIMKEKKMSARIISKVKTAIWFINKPELYNQFFQLVKSKIFTVDEKREEATEWCNNNFVSATKAFQLITGKLLPGTISDIFQSEFQEAKEIMSQFPDDRGGPGDMDLLYHLCEEKKITTVIETGVAYGWSSLAILLSLSTRSGTLLVSTDMPYAKMNGKDYVGCVVPNHLKRNWELIRLPDRQGLPKALNLSGKIGLCHYDSDKSYKGRLWAYPRLWEALIKGGLFISDDIGDNFAFKEFSDQIQRIPIIVKSDADKNISKYVGIIIK